MLDYKSFKKEMKNRGHEVHKNGCYITITPNNNCYGYAKGFSLGTDVIKGFEEFFKLVWMDHFNTWIYSIRFKLI